MDLLFVGLWFFLFLAIPVACFICAGNNYGKDSLTKIVGKFLIAFFLYLTATFISGLFTLASVLGGHKQLGEKMTSTEQIIALAGIYFYGIAGYLICSFIYGRLLKPLDLPFINSKKSQTIFNEK